MVKKITRQHSTPTSPRPDVVFCLAVKLIPETDVICQTSLEACITSPFIGPTPNPLIGYGPNSLPEEIITAELNIDGLVPQSLLCEAAISYSSHLQKISNHAASKSHGLLKRFFGLAMEPQGSKKLVPILPAQQIPDPNRQDGRATSESSVTGQGQRVRSKRNLVAVACEGCRRKKAKVRSQPYSPTLAPS